MSKPIRILVVDDEDDVCWALETALASENCEVTRCSSAEEALKLIEQTPFDVTFLDVRLPGMDGLAALTQFTRLRPESRVVIISGYFSQQDSRIQSGLQDGEFFGFIGKPLDLDEILALTEKALRAAKGGR